MILKNFLKKTFKNLPGYQKGFYLCGPNQQTTKDSSEVRFYKEFIDRKEARIQVRERRGYPE
jgi:hypothetical protein